MSRDRDRTSRKSAGLYREEVRWFVWITRSNVGVFFPVVHTVYVCALGLTSVLSSTSRSTPGPGRQISRWTSDGAPRSRNKTLWNSMKNKTVCQCEKSLGTAGLGTARNRLSNQIKIFKCICGNATVTPWLYTKDYITSNAMTQPACYFQ